MGKKVLHIPYRDSVLTKLLQSALGGNSRTTLVRPFLERVALAQLLVCYGSSNSQHAQDLSPGSALHIILPQPQCLCEKVSTLLNVLLILYCSFWVCYMEYMLLFIMSLLYDGDRKQGLAHSRQVLYH